MRTLLASVALISASIFLPQSSVAQEVKAEVDMTLIKDRSKFRSSGLCRCRFDAGCQ